MNTRQKFVNELEIFKLVRKVDLMLSLQRYNGLDFKKRVFVYKWERFTDNAHLK